MTHRKDKILVALDVETREAALALADGLRGSVGGFKIGSRLFTSEGPGMVRALTEQGDRVFLDLKYHDIPNTVAQAVAVASQLGVWMLNVHAVGGTLGAFVTGLLATPEANPNLNTNLKDIVGSTLWLEQLKAMGFTLVLSLVGTAVIAYALKATVGLRPSAENEEAGLDVSDHGERGYHLTEV